MGLYLGVRTLGVEGGFGFDGQQMDFLIGQKSMAGIARYYEQIAFLQDQVVVLELNAQLPLEHQQKFVFGLVMVPIEFAFDLGQFDRLIVQVPNQLGLPVLVEGSQFFRNIDFFHDSSRIVCWVHALGP